MHIESGPASGDRNTWIVVIVVCLGLSAFFFYDWKVRYPSHNQELAEQHLASLENAPSVEELRSTPTEAEVEKLRQAQPDSPAAYRDAFGPPTHIKPGRDELIEQYISQYGVLTVRSRGDQLIEAAWTGWKHSKEDIDNQFWWGLLPLAAALFFLVKLFRLRAFRATVDDNGLTYGGRRVAFADMVEWRNYNPKGWISLVYREGGSEKRMRLDSFRVKLFDEVIAAISQKKGWFDPNKAYFDEKERKKAEAERRAAAASGDEKP